MEKIAIIGCGGFGREVKMLIDQINSVKNQFEVIGFYDDNLNYPEMIHGIPFRGAIENINKIDFKCGVVLGIGTPEIKRQIISKIKNPFVSYPNLIHPTSIIGKDNVDFGYGNIICAGVIITIDIKLHNFITLNLSCTIGHDTEIEDYCSFMPTVNISGEVKIQEGVYVGTGAKIINQLEIGRNTIIGAGAVVAKSIPANCTAVGIPAKPIKFHE
ncbi:MAG: acetyltransferase [Flavobacteriaceae bacterium]|nr:acetyltransferase [Flavobacteriaceae bacterium]